MGYNMNAVLTIAGSDCSGGAGIQADMKTILSHGAYAMSVITALTAQNTLGVSGILNVEPAFIHAQLEAVFSDIPPQAVKIGMLGAESAASVIGRCLRKHQAGNIVIDPVMVSTSGARLAEEAVLRLAQEELYPLASLLTPNIPEAEVLSGIRINDAASMADAAEKIAQRFGCAVLCKGGHSADTADDLLYYEGQRRWLKQERIDNPNTHGTGCTLSSAIACNLAAEMALEDAVCSAKKYLTALLLDGLDLGHGSGPLNHGALLEMKKCRREGDNLS